jgi:hypothetical protein
MMSEHQAEADADHPLAAVRRRHHDECPLRPYGQRMLAVTGERLVTADSARFLPAIPADGEARIFD